MIRNLYTCLILFTACCSIGILNAQERYLEEVFTEVEVTPNIIYAENISILTGVPAPVALSCDIYTPAGDTETERPIVLVAHTGSFLPPLFSGGITGSKIDSSVVETCRRLARRGYVAVAYTYRLGWLPESDDQNVRTGTLLQAAYRGTQDSRSAIRFFRKSVAEDGNPYGIDPDKIVVWGLGTGGYLANGVAFLDRWEEVSLDKFINTATLQSFIDTTLLGNYYGTTQTPLCLPNHAEYSSDIAVALNIGGAMGDDNWLNGSDHEPVMLGYHCLRDPFAPYYKGAVIVPTTMQFVVNVSGTRRIAELANQFGLNDALANIPASVDPLQPIVEIYKNIDVTLPGDITIKLGEDHMYPFITPYLAAGLWDWWGKAQLDAVVDQVNAIFGEDFNADTLHVSNQLTNPNMSKEKAMAYIDTIFWHAIPRVCAALDLGCGFTSSIENIEPAEAGFTFGPNPSSDRIEVRTDPEYPMESISLYDLQGKLVLKHVKVKSHQFGFPVGHLPPGLYVMNTRLEKGMISEKVMIQ